MKDVLLFVNNYKVGVGVISRVIEEASFYTEEDVCNYSERNEKHIEDFGKEIQQKISKDLPELEDGISTSIIAVDKPIGQPGFYLIILFTRQLSQKHPQVLENVEIVGQLTAEEIKKLEISNLDEERQNKIKQTIDNYYNTHPYKELIDKIEAKFEIISLT